MTPDPKRPQGISLDSLADLEAEIARKIQSCTTDPELGALREEYLGRDGVFRKLFATLAKTAPEDRRDLGRTLNEAKNRVEALFEKKAAKPSQAGGFFDVTVPGIVLRRGHRHPVYRTMEEICRVFGRFGFETVYGPEIETEENNFEALNIPREHPSRDPWDSFFIENNVLLRSHTSPVQVRAMRQRRPPLRIMCPGRVFRPDTTDASHLPMFHQVEGLMVAENVSFVDLATLLDIFAKTFFGEAVKSRLRPSFFPFTEPSAEMDISCVLCGGRGCAACRGSGWIEILGCGMVHPNVFRSVGYDPNSVTGLAFGMGVERIAMLKHRIADIRFLVENRMSFLENF